MLKIESNNNHLSSLNLEEIISYDEQHSKDHLIFFDNYIQISKDNFLKAFLAMSNYQQYLRLEFLLNPPMTLKQYGNKKKRHLI